MPLVEGPAFCIKAGEFAKETVMDQSVVDEMLDELLPSFEALETQNAAILQFLKEKGITTDEQLAPYLEQARNASSIRWGAVRLRMRHLLAPLFNSAEKPTEKKPSEPVQKGAEGTGAAANQTPSGKEHQHESSSRPDQSASSAKKTNFPAAEKKDTEKPGSRDQAEKDIA
jgi:hypothetical protein